MTRTPAFLHSTLPAAIVSIVASGCFTAPTVTGTTQAVVATWEVYDATPDDCEDQTYAVGDTLPSFVLKADWIDNSGPLNIYCTLSQEVVPSALTLADTGDDGILEAGDSVSRTFSMSDQDATLDCISVSYDIPGADVHSILEIIEGVYDVGVVPVSIWMNGEESSTASLAYVAP